MRKFIAASSLAVMGLVPAVAAAQQPGPGDIPPPVPHDGQLTEADIQRTLDLARQELGAEAFATFERQLREGNVPVEGSPTAVPVRSAPRFTG